MCGICGVWDRTGSPVDPGVLVRMRDAMVHRGPDGEGLGLFRSDGSAAPVVWHRPTSSPELAGGAHDLGFGHRRLAIVGVESGAQPMSNEDGTVFVVANGEIYNHLELRRDLEGRGHRFGTSCDVEVIAHLYEEHGDGFPALMNGIFAFALWDSRTRMLMLCRDQLGVKPLYFAVLGDTVLFASEVKALLEHPAAPREVDLEALALCLTFRYCPAPRTLLRSVRKLAPGTLVRISAGEVEERRYWSGGGRADRSASEGEWVDRLVESLRRAVDRQLMSDVPLGLSLSGGVDSAALLALMSRGSGEAVSAFTIGFEGDEARSEVPAARSLASRYGARFTSRIVSAGDYAALMGRYMWHLEEPIGNESAAAYYFVAAMAAEAGVKVLLTGQGPDELFAGYDRYLGPRYGHLLRPLLAPQLQAPLRRLLGGVSRREQYERMIAFAGGSSEPAAIASMWSLFGGGENLPEVLSPDVRSSLRDGLPSEVIEAELARAPEGATGLERLLWLDTRTVLPENLLLAEDKMAMAASVEARVPYLDVELVELAEAIPGRMKLRGIRNKHVHRRACAKVVGPSAAFAKKVGFTNPMASWLRGELGARLREEVSDPRSLASSYLDQDHVRRMLDEHGRGARDHTKALFLLYSLEQWHQVFVRGDVPTLPSPSPAPTEAPARAPGAEVRRP